LRKRGPFRYRRPPEHQNGTTLQHIIVQTISTEHKERILKAVREKNQIAYYGKPLKITAEFSTETLKARRVWTVVFCALKENNFSPLYPAKLSFKIKGEINTFHDKQKLN
jgi:hypothetical protein